MQNFYFVAPSQPISVIHNMSICCFDIVCKRNDWMDGQETLSEQKNQTKKKLNTWDNQNVRIELTFTNIWSSSNCFIDKHNLIEK